ncbi:hypothetical protein DFH27DRAFT_529256 [Peziza echinospora]|nr:hypothetical protein DFH27DRAFT_529256 [Peziza echinospora]
MVPYSTIVNETKHGPRNNKTSTCLVQFVHHAYILLVLSSIYTLNHDKTCILLLEAITQVQGHIMSTAPYKATSMRSRRCFLYQILGTCILFANAIGAGGRPAE